MVEGNNHTCFDGLRKATLHNNLIWLQSFGCEVEDYGDLVHIHHPQLPAYSAWLITSPAEESNRQLKNLLKRVKGASATPDIYLDEVSCDLANRQMLAENDFNNDFVSLTLVSPVLPQRNPSALTLKRADRSCFNEWLALYAEGFNRLGRDAEIDRSRWLLALERSDAVRPWFFLKGDDVVGICQTCEAEGVVGAYSFTLRPRFRGVRWIRAANCALNARAAEMGERYLYLERLLPAQSNRVRRRVNSNSRIVLIRKMFGFRRSSPGP